MSALALICSNADSLLPFTTEIASLSLAASLLLAMPAAALPALPTAFLATPGAPTIPAEVKPPNAPSPIFSPTPAIIDLFGST